MNVFQSIIVVHVDIFLVIIYVIQFSIQVRVVRKLQYLMIAIMKLV